MKDFHVFLDRVPRKTSFAPHVRSIGFLNGARPLRGVRSPGLQFCLRFQADAAETICSIGNVSCRGAFPHLLIKRPGEVLDYKENFTASSLYIVYDGEVLDDMRSRGLSDDLHLLEFDRIPARVLPLIRRLELLFSHAFENGNAARIDLVCLNLIQELLLAEDEKNPDLCESEKRLSRAVSLMELSFRENVSIENFARKAGLSVRTFYRLWHQKHEQSPSEYRTELRLREAEHLLSETEKTVGEIALELGFREEAYFCGVFRKSRGITPGKFRDKLKTDPDFSGSQTNSNTGVLTL